MTLVIYADPEPAPPRRGRMRPSPQTVQLGTLMVAIAMVAVCLAVLRVSLGFGVLLILILVPASGRTIAAVLRRHARGRRMDWSERLELFVLSLCIVVVIGLASLVAFAATCFPSGVILGNGAGIWGLVVAVIIGIGAAGCVAYSLIRRLWPYKEW